MVSERRTFRVAEKLRGLISKELLLAADPRFFMVTVTSVVVNQDLSEAKVYWSVSGGDARIKEVEKAFSSAAGRLRRNVGKGVGLRQVPRLRFYYDDTLDTVAEVDRLLREANIRND